jgi:hypothetical protein
LLLLCSNKTNAIRKLGVTNTSVGFRFACFLPASLPSGSADCARAHRISRRDRAPHLTPPAPEPTATACLRLRSRGATPFRDSASFSGKERGTLGVVRLACLGGIGAGPAFCVVSGNRFSCPCECARDRGDLRLALQLCGEILVGF